MPKLIDIFARFRESCDTLTVYTMEAHPIGGWEAPDQPHRVVQSVSNEERLRVARDFFASRDVGRLAVDCMEDYAVRIYQSFPDRLLVVGGDRRLVYVQPVGPPGYHPHMLEAFLETFLSGT